MSEVRLVIRDARRDLHACRHGSFAERGVAALSAEPETIEELAAALDRFQVSHPIGHFAGFCCGVDDEPYDAGVVIIDLAARLVVADGTYFSPTRDGYVNYHDGRSATDICARFHLSDDWEISHDALTWRSHAEIRRRERAANPPFDARAVVYGPPLLEFIARECFAAFHHRPLTSIQAAAASRATSPPSVQGDAEAPTNVDVQSGGEDEEAIRQIHARWLMTPRDDLRGQTPREVMVARRSHISWDSQDRQEQWSQSGKCPPVLDPQSAAYRFAGFGTHELVVYYYLVRELLWSCREAVTQAIASGSAKPSNSVFAMSETQRLALLRDDWLDAPNFEFSGHIPRSIIQNERMRRPEGMSGHEAMIDCDCPICQMQADMPGPVFWHLDGCNMDDEFAFSIYHRTLEEWENEQREHEEFSRRFEARQAERERLGVKRPGGGFADPNDVWRRSFYAPEAEGQSLLMRLFAVGFSLSELVVDLKEVASEDNLSAEAVDLVHRLNRDYGNLRATAQSDDFDAAAALIDPVLDRFRQTLDDAATFRPDLEPKCTDLQIRLRRFLEPPSAEGIEEDAENWSDDDLPY